MPAWMVRKTHTGERGGYGPCEAAGAALEVQTAEGAVVIEAREADSCEDPTLATQEVAPCCPGETR